MIKPMKFKGKNKKNNYFEGWYYKCVSKDETTTLSLIPGISLNKDNPHSFIQVILNNNEIKTTYLEFEISDFNYNYQTNILSVQDNHFAIDYFDIDYSDDDFEIKGKVKLKNHKPIKTSIFSPSIMGFFQYLPLMECTHEVVSMNHDLLGMITINGKSYDFCNGKGYIEKDYGRGFPSEYVWLQSNHFSQERVSLMFSYAIIPYLGFKFKGFIVNLIIEDKEYRFATYNFSKIKIIEREKNFISFMIKKSKYSLFIKAKNKNTIALAAPKEGKMDNFIKEGLSGEVEVIFKHKDKVIFEDKGIRCGIEIMLK
ncbi:MAG: tocopherol cyclase family protein [Bacilli bacterium]|nr:tocopherol cyclase family protein [Bacilli bacterium]